MDTSYTIARKKHGKHNEKAYRYIKKEGEFTDWAIIAAFYSALHFVESYLFPFTDWDDEVYEAINEFHYSDKIDLKSKHETREHLIKARCKFIKTDYQRLKELCWKARYDNFDISSPQRTLKDVERRLENIKDKLEISDP